MRLPDTNTLGRPDLAWEGGPLPGGAPGPRPRLRTAGRCPPGPWRSTATGPDRTAGTARIRADSRTASRDGCSPRCRTAPRRPGARDGTGGDTSASPTGRTADVRPWLAVIGP